VPRVGDLKEEIKQERDFHSVEEQALLNLLRTADFLDRAVEHKIRPFGITSTQYNVLRILRGAHPRGLTCSAIGDRMITPEPDVTRLLSRLRNIKLVKQHRDQKDRRVLWTQISAQGLKLLREMDPMVERAPIELLGHLQREELERLIKLLEAARKPCGIRSGQPSCDGKGESGSPGSQNRDPGHPGTLQN
jgi:DNA-binding MarR family transcriptional regulator